MLQVHHRTFLPCAMYSVPIAGFPFVAPEGEHSNAQTDLHAVDTARLIPRMAPFQFGVQASNIKALAGNGAMYLIPPMHLRPTVKHLPSHPLVLLLLPPMPCHQSHIQRKVPAGCHAQSIGLGCLGA